MKKSIRYISVFGILISSLFFSRAIIAEGTEPVVRAITFPVIGTVTFSEDFGDARGGGRTHEGNDLLGTKGQPLIAAVDGVISYVAYPQPYWGYMISIKDADGYTYNYVHMNNDMPGTDDGAGGAIHAYAPGVETGDTVVHGQLIGWMGDSGNAEETTPHVHFEIRLPDGTAIDPYQSLRAATHIDSPVPAPQQDGELLPYGEFDGGAHIALGSIDADSDDEIITGVASGKAPRVKISGTNGTVDGSFFAYEEEFFGGVNVAVGDVNGDSINDIITTPGNGHTPEVRVFSTNGTLLSSFLAFPETMQFGLSVAVADVDGDGVDDIITGKGAGGNSRIRIFSSTGKRKASFLAYAPEMRNGVDVAAQDGIENQSGFIVTGPGAGTKSIVKLFTHTGAPVQQFRAYGKKFTGGVHVAISQSSENSTLPQILTVPASNGPDNARVFNSRGAMRASYSAFEPWWQGGFDIAAGSDSILISSFGGRRTSIRSVF